MIVASAAATLAKLGVGSNNQVLTADSAQTTGVKWAAAAVAIWKVIDTAGNGDYTTFGAAYTAGFRNFIMLPGTVTETTGTVSAWASQVTIVGVNRDTCIIQLAGNATTGQMNLSGNNNFITNVTIKAGNISLTNTYDGWVTISGNDSTWNNVLFLGQNSASNTGYTVAIQGGTRHTFTNCYFKNSSVTGAFYFDAGNEIKLIGCHWNQSQGRSIDSYNFHTSGATHSVLIQGCDIINTFAGNNIINFNNRTGDGVDRVQFIGNYCELSPGSFNKGINFTPAAAAQSYGQFKDNIIKMVTGTISFYINSCQDLDLSGNQIDKSAIDAEDTITILSTTRGSVTNNHLYSTAASTASMIGMTISTCNGFTVSGNTVYGYLGAGSVGINLSSCTRTKVIANDLTNCGTGIKDSSGDVSNIYGMNTFSACTADYNVTRPSRFVNTESYIVKTTSYTLTTTDDMVISSVAAGIITITLPTAVGIPGKIYTVKDNGSAGTNNVTIATTSSQTIDGAATKTINTNYGFYRMLSDGANWFTL